jgi:hypothetical protein
VSRWGCRSGTTQSLLGKRKSDSLLSWLARSKTHTIASGWIKRTYHPWSLLVQMDVASDPFFFNLPSSSPSNTTTYVYAFLSLCKHSNSFRLNSLPPMSFRHPLYITSAPPEFENSGKGLNSLHTVGHSCLVVRLGGGESQQQQA